MHLTRITTDVVQVPLTIPHRRQVAQQFVIALEQRSITRQLIANGLVYGVRTVSLAQQYRQQALADDRLHFPTCIRALWLGNTHHLQQRWHNIGDMGEAACNLPSRHPWYSADDQRHAKTTLTGKELVGRQRSRRRTGPTGAQHSIAALGTHLLQVIAVLELQPQLGQQDVVRVRGLGAIVGKKHKHGIGVLARLLEVLDQTPDLRIHGLGHAGIHLHAPLLVAFLFFAEAAPITGTGHTHHCRILSNQAQLGGTVASCLAQCIPTVLVDAPVLVDVSLGCLKWNMVGLEGHIGKERLSIPTLAIDVLQRFVDE
ncbi:hypothetical protein D9M68_654510 [compost metagenome]